ncbi:mannitol dehydrogenase family protein [Rhodococcus sp. IEGM 1354]|uniref:mannitol dehydrogenase family protein n=1 Tax=Rhodococcus sp. IEGM 1354 TaxID=3047088 RepID=UPI0024B7F9D7|nr:mannitol dehydrogenase family protein [Rhodococcus sp. IEGM 1354]MDI9932437.1 mannitol dehydrogenase family protein [Rhodococcus sp. IEGM 1354]
MTELGRTTLEHLPATVARPEYDADELHCGVVHFGVGAFHRAHQAVYFDRLLAAGHLDWALCGVGVLPQDKRIGEVLDAQDYLYTLVTVDPDGIRDARVVGSVADFVFAPDDPQTVIDVLSSPSTMIVSLTITEGGYGVDDLTGAFEPTDPSVLADLEDLSTPTSVFGFLTVALATRRFHGVPPFTVMSCDNIVHNGAVARTALTSFARHHDRDLADWIDSTVAFPNSMVDRITPATTSTVIEDARRDFGIDDRWPVQSESFSQWVLEDTFSFGRPPFDEVGVQLVSDVAPYEHMKLRLLNGSHQAMSYLGIIAGYTHVHEVMADPDMREFVASYMRAEVAPTLAPVPGIDLDAYIEQLLQRFSSLAVRDTLERQIVDASARIPKFVLPVLRDRLAHDRTVDHCALILAGWCGVYERGDVPMMDVDAERLQRLSWEDHDNPGAFLTNRAVFGDLAGSPRLRGAYQRAKRSLQDNGARGAVRRLLEQSSVSHTL